MRRLPDLQMAACAILGCLLFISVVFRALGMVH